MSRHPELNSYIYQVHTAWYYDARTERTNHCYCLCVLASQLDYVLHPETFVVVLPTSPITGNPVVGVFIYNFTEPTFARGPQAVECGELHGPRTRLATKIDQ
ncbi:unnamed protein product, partial [Scytosiphon promiscuus]